MKAYSTDCNTLPYGSLLDHIAELTAERDALKKDAERLDWMEKHPRLAELITEDGVTTDCFYYAVAGASGVRLRDIIDAAMAKVE